MLHTIERKWQRAQAYVTGGNFAAARAIYESILQIDANHVSARLCLSALEQVTGHYRASREHAIKAADTVSNDRRWKDLAKVTHRLLPYDEHDLIHDLIVNADWSNTEVLTNSAILSQQLWLSNHFDEALRLIEAARLRAAPSHLLSYSRANALRYCGRMQEATEEYERCLQLAPGYAYGHWSLAYHEKADPPGSRVARIKKAQAGVAENSPEHAYLQYALFKELDDAGEVDQAWTALMAGARSKRQSIHYDSAREERGRLALQQRVGHDFIGDRIEEDSSERVPIFIVGMPRTGTTVMERILSNHSQIATAGELNDFGGALCWVADTFMGDSMNVASVEKLGNIDFSHVGRRYLQRTRGRSADSRYLIDKNPMNFFNAGYIAKALPQAKIIWLDRGPMDACLSNLKELFTGEAYGYSYELRELADHYVRFKRLAEHWQDVLPGRIHRVPYETLVADPLRISEQVMAFCGVPFEPECIEITRNDSPVSTASSSQVRQPINARGVNAWRRYSSQLAPLQEMLEQAASLP